MRVFIGFDGREQAAAAVCRSSLMRVTRGGLVPEFLDVSDLRRRGLLTRIRDERGAQDYDLVSNRHYSTRFNVSRFLVPILCQGGPALFVDCDTVFVRDPREMLWLDLDTAIAVVKHNQEPTPGATKMVDQAQTAYPRKNWSSVMLFNCDHPANRRLSLWDVNNRHRDELHAFYWLHDSEIDDLAPEWNWLVDVEPRPEDLGIAHMTLGGPWLPGWSGGSFDEEWRLAAML